MNTWIGTGSRHSILENWYVLRHEGGASVAIAACSVSTPLNRIAFEGLHADHNDRATFEVVDKAEMKRRPNVVITK